MNAAVTQITTNESATKGWSCKFYTRQQHMHVQMDAGGLQWCAKPVTCEDCILDQKYTENNSYRAIHPHSRVETTAPIVPGSTPKSPNALQSASPWCYQNPHELGAHSNSSWCPQKQQSIRVRFVHLWPASVGRRGTNRVTWAA